MVTFHRRLPRFDYLAPDKLKEVLSLIAEKEQDEFLLYAGGTDVIPKLKRRLIKRPKVLIDLKRISDLDYISYDTEKGLKIGALATVASVSNSPIARKCFPVLSLAANSIAATQIQNRATVVGNICNAVPSADSAPALLTLKASLVCVSIRGERVIPLEEFFIGPNQSVLKKDEIVKEIRIPNLPKHSKSTYIKLSPRKKMDLAVVGVAVVVLPENGICKDIRIGLGAVAPTPIRARKAEEGLMGRELNRETIKHCSETAADESRPIDDHRASAYYRKAMVRVLVQRAIGKILST